MSDPATIPDDDRLLEQALDWLLALQETPDPNEAELRAAYAQWRAATPRHTDAAARAERLWRVSAALEPVSTPTSAVAMPQRRRWRHRYAFAACAAILLAFVALPELWRIGQADYRTHTGERLEIVLPDGSQLHLDSRSAVALDYSAERRRIRVLDGHAWFEVADDAARPFSVEAGPVRATDIGTAFEVGRDGDRVLIAVENGLVRVETGGELLAELPAGKQLAIDEQARPAVIRDIAPQLVASWRHGQLVVDDESVAAVVERLRAYAPGLIVITDGGLAQQRVSGSYSLKDPAAALEAVVQPHGGRVQRVTPFLLIVSSS